MEKYSEIKPVLPTDGLANEKEQRWGKDSSIHNKYSQTSSKKRAWASSVREDNRILENLT